MTITDSPLGIHRELKMNRLMANCNATSNSKKTLFVHKIAVKGGGPFHAII